jgi:hypothetical protein
MVEQKQSNQVASNSGEGKNLVKFERSPSKEGEISSKIKFIKAAIKNLKSNFPRNKSVRVTSLNNLLG